MKRKTLLWIFLSTSLVVLMSAGSVFAAGFALYEGGARGLVLGAGLTGSADDPSAVFYNPAGITQLKGIQTMIGVTAINPVMTVTTVGNFAIAATPTITGTTSRETDMEDNWFFPPHAYFTQQINDKLWWGAGIFSRFGLGTEFENSWPGRFNSTKAKINTLEFNPNIAYKINDTLSVAAGLSVMWFQANLQRQLDTRALGVGETHFELDGDSYGYGWNVALHWKPLDWLSTGITYRSRVKQELSGDVTTSQQLRGTPVGNLISMGGEADINLPSEVFWGVNFKVLKNLSLGGGIYWTEWSTFDQLQVRFDQPFRGSTTSTTRKDWDNVFRYMIGMEWNVTNNWDLRLSYAYDEAPEPDEHVDYLLPDNDRQQFTIGCGYHNGPWLVDLAYMYIMFEDRDVTARPADYVLAGKFEGYAHLIGLSFGYKF
ncbi:MAG: OmpP1/FadL family transporter [Deltaproteobacteria bacterium]|nr:OmpP1/FadL family transporter [Deltaproteobacteria bacterium]